MKWELFGNGSLLTEVIRIINWRLPLNEHYAIVNLNCKERRCCFMFNKLNAEIVTCGEVYAK